ncbi:hypothetical protein [Glaciibacter flavus]|uniref:hypothetical protein n=1 Tax=Orlajensenia flava TaxID=2565934 RepID=UPI003AFF7228
MSASDLVEWLNANPTPGYGVSGSSGPTADSRDPSTMGRYVIVETVGGVAADNGIVLSTAPLGNGTAIRVDAIVNPPTSTCVKPPPDGQYALGG